MRTAMFATVAVLAISTTSGALAQDRCYVDASGNVRCLGGPTIYNQGNGAYRDLSGNRWQFETPPEPMPRPALPSYDRSVNPYDTQTRCRYFPDQCR